MEFALVVPVLAALLLGTVTAGLAYNRNNSLNNASREAARYGATLPVGSDLTTWLNTVADVARESASGDLDPAVSGQQLCVAYVHPAGTTADDRTTRLIEVAGSRTVGVGSPCFNDGRPGTERRVQVEMSRTTRLDAVFHSTTLTLTAESVTLFERALG